MDNLKEYVENEKDIGIENPERREVRTRNGALIYSLVFFAIGILLSRCHIVFGARPLSVAYVSMLPVSAFSATLGCVLGALTLGKEGVMYALAVSLALLLRIIMSGSTKNDGALFGEPLLLRICTSVLSGFCAAAYEVLSRGLNYTTMMFGLSMIFIPPILTFVFSGIFSTGFSLSGIFCDSGNVFSMSRKKTREKNDIIFFQISALTALFFISLSMKEYELFGISLAYVFVSLMTMLTAKRFGALRAMAVGFFSALGLSGLHAAGFALAGLGGGILFGFGTAFGILGALASICAWCYYSTGLVGFLSIAPELIIATTLTVPILKNVLVERSSDDAHESELTATEMVGTMALCYRGKYTQNLDTLESSLSSLASVLRKNSPSRSTLSTEEYRSIILDTADKKCKSCKNAPICEKQDVHPCKKNSYSIAQKLKKGEKLFAEDINTDVEFCQKANELCDELASETARAECELFRLNESSKSAEEYELISKLISEARASDEKERTLNTSVSEQVSLALRECGYSDWVARVFGERRRHFIIAGEDRDGTRIVSSDFRGIIESAAKTKLGASEYFRRGDMALVECNEKKRFSVECATATLSGDRREVSGDTVSAFESDNGYFYALISDGMGRGELAKRTSEFVLGFLRRALNFSASKDTVLHLLNRSIRRGRDECSATVDLFELDLYTGDAIFIKSGCAPSYVKRESSLFRIKSQTAPIGLLNTIDTEKIRVEIHDGDIIVMLSDGISQTSDDAPWLLEFMSRPIRKDSLKDYADKIIALAKEKSKSGDDMSVAVLKISELS